jgi:hypothetical protein
LPVIWEQIFEPKKESNGNPISGVGSFNSLDGIDFALAAQDSTDKNKYTATIPAYSDQDPQDSQVTAGFMVPALDTTGDGVIDYTAGTVNITNNDVFRQGGKPTAILNLSPFDPGGTSISVIKTSYNSRFNAGSTTYRFLGKGDSVLLFFNQPVTLVSDIPVTMSFTDNLKALTATATVTDYTAANNGITVSQALNNILLTIKPASAMTELGTYSLKGLLQGYPVGNASYDLETQDLSNLGAGTFYVTYTEATNSLSGSSPKITVDNFNNCTNGVAIGTPDPGNCTVGGTASTLSLLFPEPVNGRVTINSYKEGSAAAVTTGLPSVSGTPICAPNNMVYYPKANTAATSPSNGTKGGTYDGAACEVSLTGLNLADSTSGTSRTVNVYFDIWDSDGNHYTKTVDLSVQ